MTALQTQTELRIAEISHQAFEAFCDEISSVFDLEVKCQQLDIIIETVRRLKKRFGKFAAVNNIDSTGFFNGSFQVIFDHDGLFTLGGVITMQPEDQIIANRKNSSTKLFDNMIDAMGEVGNLLVKSWNGILKEQTDGQSHLEQRLPVIIGKNWHKSTNSIIFSKDHELILILYQMTINSFESFQCGVLFPKAILKDDFDSETEMAIDTPEHYPEDDTTKKEKAQKEAAMSGNGNKGDSSEQIKKSAKDTNINKHQKKTDTGKTKTARKSKKAGIKNTSGSIPKKTKSPDNSTNKPADRLQKPKRVAKNSINGIMHKTARDIMDDKILWVSQEESVQEVHEKILQNNVDYALVGQNNILEGIVSKSDISGAMSPYLRPIFSKWHRFQDDATLQIKVKWIMSKSVHTIKIDTPLEKILETFSQMTGHALPVVDDQDHVLGMVTDHYIFNTLLNLK